MDKLKNDGVLSPPDAEKQPSAGYAPMGADAEDPSSSSSGSPAPSAGKKTAVKSKKAKKSRQARISEPSGDVYAPSQKFHDIKKRRRKGVFGKYNFVSLIAVGFIGFFISQLLLGAVFSIVSFAARIDPDASAFLPAMIYIAGLLAASAFITLLIKGGTVWPCLILAILVTAATAALAGSEALTFWGVSKKLLISLLIATVGFTVAKLYIRSERNRRMRRRAH